jgi:hypothetical protein
VEDDRPRLVVERRHVHAAWRRLDPDLAAADDPVQAALVPEIGEVDSECPEPLGRELEVVRFGQGQEGHVPNVLVWLGCVSEVLTASTLMADLSAHKERCSISVRKGHVSSRRDG